MLCDSSKSIGERAAGLHLSLAEAIVPQKVSEIKKAESCRMPRTPFSYQETTLTNAAEITPATMDSGPIFAPFLGNSICGEGFPYEFDVRMAAFAGQILGHKSLRFRFAWNLEIVAFLQDRTMVRDSAKFTGTGNLAG